jgi:hypothetical protein
MKTNPKFLRTVLGGIGAVMLLSAPHAFAFPTSGTCAMLVTPPVPVGASIPHGDTYNVLATMTFTGATTGTMDFHAAGVQYTSSGVEYFPANDKTRLGLSVAIGPSSLPGARGLSFTIDGTLVTANAFAVNGDRTLLIQGATEPFSGVCQF